MENDALKVDIAKQTDELSETLKVCINNFDHKGFREAIGDIQAARNLSRQQLFELSQTVLRTVGEKQETLTPQQRLTFSTLLIDMCAIKNAQEEKTIEAFEDKLVKGLEKSNAFQMSMLEAQELEKNYKSVLLRGEIITPHQFIDEISKTPKVLSNLECISRFDNAPKGIVGQTKDKEKSQCAAILSNVGKNKIIGISTLSDDGKTALSHEDAKEMVAAIYGYNEVEVKRDHTYAPNIEKDEVLLFKGTTTGKDGKNVEFTHYVLHAKQAEELVKQHKDEIKKIRNTPDFEESGLLYYKSDNGKERGASQRGYNPVKEITPIRYGTIPVPEGEKQIQELKPKSQVEAPVACPSREELMKLRSPSMPKNNGADLQTSTLQH